MGLGRARLRFITHEGAAPFSAIQRPIRHAESEREAQESGGDLHATTDVAAVVARFSRRLHPASDGRMRVQRVYYIHEHPGANIPLEVRLWFPFCFDRCASKVQEDHSRDR